MNRYQNMKPFSILLLLVAVASFAGCDSDAESPIANKDNSGSAVQPIKEPVQVPSDTTKPDAAPDVPSKTQFGDQYPEVLAVKVFGSQGNQWRFDVTLSSSYDTPQRYADAWRVLSDQDNELGIRILGHDHASEQPFTRSGTFEIPKGTQAVFVEGRDQENGWSGQRFKVQMP